jgi:hypothetical protein
MLRDGVVRIWPELEWISDEDLRERASRCWERAFELSPLSPADLERIPFTGVALAMECGLPDAVTHIVASHAGERGRPGRPDHRGVAGPTRRLHDLRAVCEAPAGLTRLLPFVIRNPRVPDDERKTEEMRMTSGTPVPEIEFGVIYSCIETRSARHV